MFETNSLQNTRYIFHYPNYTIFKDHFTNIKSISSLNQRYFVIILMQQRIKHFPCQLHFPSQEMLKIYHLHIYIYTYILIYFDKLFLKRVNYFSLTNTELRKLTIPSK